MLQLLKCTCTVSLIVKFSKVCWTVNLFVMCFKVSGVCTMPTTFVYVDNKKMLVQEITILLKQKLLYCIPMQWLSWKLFFVMNNRGKKSKISCETDRSKSSISVTVVDSKNKIWWAALKHLYFLCMVPLRYLLSHISFLKKPGLKLDCWNSKQYIQSCDFPKT